MTSKDRQNMGPGAEEAEDEERPTVTPPFDPETFAKDLLDEPPTKAPRRTPPYGTTRPAAGSGESATEPPPRKREGTIVGVGIGTMSDLPPPTSLNNPESSTRRDLLSLADARGPTRAPPALASESMSDPPPLVLEGLDEAPTRPSAEPARSRISDRFAVAVRVEDVRPTGAPNRRTPPLVHAPPVSEPPDSRAQTAPPPSLPNLVPDDLSARENSVYSTSRSSPALRAAGRRPSAELLSARASVSNLAKAESPLEQKLREMRERVSLGDYTGALVIAEGLLETSPNLGEAKDCAESCRSVLRQMYTARIGPLDRVPVVTVARDQMRWLSIDHRAGFVLSHVDGVSSLEMILDVSGMPSLDALRILCELHQQRIISFR